jgi:aldose 1-epimerase
MTRRRIIAKKTEKRGQGIYMSKASVHEFLFGRMPDGRAVKGFCLSSGKLEFTVTTYGARIEKAIYDGVSVICGFDTLDGQLKDTCYQGSTVGRYANRISDGKFSLNGVEYKLACNESSRGEHLHGGNVGFSARVWDVVGTDVTENEASVTLSLFSPDGEEGYPGALTVYVTFTAANDAINIDYKAKSDKDTIINLTNHSYFNLSGVGGTILDHKLTSACGKYVPVNDRLIPFGEIADVTGTPFDFREGKTIGRDIDADDKQLKTAGGYDHCFVRGNGEEKKEPEWMCTVESPVTGIKMNIFTTEGGIQMYTGNFMTEDNPFFCGIKQIKNGAVALECNRMPDSPNQKNFPSPVLRAGEEYRQITVYKFTK